MAAGYPIPASPVRIENRITKSLFITCLFHAKSPVHFSQTLDEIRKEHKGAAHNCWAYITGAPDDSAKWGMSDAGEPKGCAGKPMLHVLSHAGIGEIGSIVTRYYGGVKLGTGGLTRAYSRSVQLALQEMQTAVKTVFAYFSLVLPYALQPAVDRIIQHHHAQVAQACYESVISLEIGVPEDHAPSFHQDLKQLRHPELLVTARQPEET